MTPDHIIVENAYDFDRGFFDNSALVKETKPMPMATDGVAKLIEECGELQQILGKKLAYWNQDMHPDGKSIKDRIQEEMGDVVAAIRFVAETLQLDTDFINERADAKHALFTEWHQSN